MKRQGLAYRGRSRARWLTGCAAVLLAGCASSARPPAAPAPAGSGPAFEKARAECTHKALETTQDMRPQDVASKAAIGVYMQCMHEKGFHVGESGPK